jgi:hypothetical protein
VEQAGAVFHVIPTEVRDRNGNWSRYDSLLDTRISVPTADRTEEELYRAIAAQVRAVAQVRLDVTINGGIGLDLVAPQARTRMGATREPARSVLTRAVQLYCISRTWVLLHGPEHGVGAFALGIWDFPAREQPAPAT